MKKEARLLKDKALSSLALSIDHFNRTSDLGRVDSVLMFLDHAFEMLLKASILHRGGKIRPLGRKTLSASTLAFGARSRTAVFSS